MTVFDEQGRKVSRNHDFTSIKIRTGSAVDRPAQEPAVAVMLLKRRDEDDGEGVGDLRHTNSDKTRVEASKNMGAPGLTTSEQGHTHLVDLDERSGFTTWELMPGGELGHSHPYVIDAEGNLTVGEAEGHTHGLSVEARKGADGPKAGEPTMTPEEQAQLDAEKKRADEAESELKTQKALAAMSDDEKAHRATLEGDAIKAFDELETEARVEAVKAAKAKDSDKVVAYKARDGRTFYEGESDPLVVAEVKRGDALEARVEKAEDEAKLTVLKSRAKEELSHLPGDEKSKVAMLKAIDGIEDDEERKEALAALKAGNAHAAGAFKRHGASGGPTGSDASDVDPAGKFEAEVKKYAEAHKVSLSKARIDYGDTEEGRKLYREHAEANQTAGV